VQEYDFSKSMFGSCGLLPDMVRAVPVWIDDPELQRYLYVNVMLKDSGGNDSQGLTLDSNEYAFGRT
jgi:hypothetical protein